MSPRIEFRVQDSMKVHCSRSMSIAGPGNGTKNACLYLRVHKTRSFDTCYHFFQDKGSVRIFNVARTRKHDSVLCNTDFKAAKEFCIQDTHAIGCIPVHDSIAAAKPSNPPWSPKWLTSSCAWTEKGEGAPLRSAQRSRKMRLTSLPQVSSLVRSLFCIFSCLNTCYLRLPCNVNFSSHMTLVLVY